MAKIVLEEQPEFTTFPVDSILELKVDECNVKTVDGRNGPWQKVEFKFKILGIQAIGDGSPIENYDAMITQHIWGSVPFRLTDSAENKLRQFAEAILGMELGVGFELDTDMFVNRQCRGLTSQYEKKVAGQPSIWRHQVEALLPKTGGFGTPAAAAPAATGGDPWAAPKQPAPVGAPADNPWGNSWDTGDEPPF